MLPLSIPKKFKFFLGSLAGVVADLAIASLLYKSFNLPLPLSSLTSFFVASWVNFLFQFYWTFSKENTFIHIFPTYLKFLLSSLFGLFTRFCVVFILSALFSSFLTHTNLLYFPILLLGTASSFFVNYFLSSKFIFSKK